MIGFARCEGLRMVLRLLVLACPVVYNTGCARDQVFLNDVSSNCVKLT